MRTSRGECIAETEYSISWERRREEETTASMNEQDSISSTFTVSWIDFDRVQIMTYQILLIEGTPRGQL
jgi:hypothetical protein